MAYSRTRTPSERQTAAKLFQILGNPIKKREENSIRFISSLLQLVAQGLPPNNVRCHADSQRYTTALFIQSCVCFMKVRF